MRESTLIKMAATDYRLRPTFEAYGEVEERMNMPLRQVYASAASGMLTIAQTAQIIKIGVDASEEFSNGFSLENVQKHLFEMGPFSPEVIEPVSNYLASLGWTPEQRKKIAAAIEQQEAETAPSA